MMYSVTKRQNPLDRQADSKYYASAEYGEEIDVNALAKEISKSCTLTPADIIAVIQSFLDKMPQYLKSSNRIRLNKFGIFKLSFSSIGHEKAEDVSSNDIKNLRVLFTPSAELKKELSDVSYTRKQVQLLEVAQKQFVLKYQSRSDLNLRHKINSLLIHGC